MQTLKMNIYKFDQTSFTIFSNILIKNPELSPALCPKIIELLEKSKLKMKDYRDMLGEYIKEKENYQKLSNYKLLFFLFILTNAL